MAMSYIMWKMEKMVGHAVNIENSVWMCANKCNFIESSHLFSSLCWNGLLKWSAHGFA